MMMIEKVREVGRWPSSAHRKPSKPSKEPQMATLQELAKPFKGRKGRHEVVWVVGSNTLTDDMSDAVAQAEQVARESEPLVAASGGEGEAITASPPAPPQKRKYVRKTQTTEAAPASAAEAPITAPRRRG
jgi:hypothetical protein